MVKVGSKARDTITGLEGVVVARTEWLNGCIRITIQPQFLKDGRPVEAYSVDEQQVQVLSEPDTVAQAPETSKTGGPTPEPSRCSDPIR